MYITLISVSWTFMMAKIKKVNRGLNSSHQNEKKKTISKAKKKDQKQYSDAVIQLALNEMGQGKSIRELSAQFQIPKSTLYNKSKTCQ